jgi:hypothetical protein
MPLDIYMGDDRKAALCCAPAASLDERGHKALFGGDGLPVGCFPLLGRINDYYRDSAYGAHEVESLLAETEQALALLAGNETAQAALLAIAQICRRALRCKARLWFICD